MLCSVLMLGQSTFCLFSSVFQVLQHLLQPHWIDLGRVQLSGCHTCFLPCTKTEKRTLSECLAHGMCFSHQPLTGICVSGHEVFPSCPCSQLHSLSSNP